MNETIVKEKMSPQKKRNAVISLFLVLALLITGAFAFLTSTDSKVNKFTIGKVDVTLQEYDGDTAWWEVDANTQHTTDELTTDVDENANGISDNMENILPGDYVGKKPVVTNLGKNDAWTYLVVAVPTAQKSDIVRAAGDNGVVGVEGLSDVSIDVYTYAIQPGYIDDGTTEDITTVWDKFTNSEQNYENMFGEEATTDLSTRIELFKKISVGTDDTRTEFDINNAEGWTQFSTYKCSDGKNYYVYGMNEKLAVDADSPALFDGFELIKAIGEAEPVGVYYFVKDDVISNQQGVGAGNADLDVLVPSVDGYHLIETQYYNPGDKLTLIDDHFNAPTESWNYINQKTGEAAYEGQIVNEAMTLLGTAEDLDLVNVIPQEYLMFERISQKVYFYGVHASYWSDHPNVTECSLVIPDTLSCSGGDNYISACYTKNVRDQAKPNDVQWLKTDSGYLYLDNYPASYATFTNLPVDIINGGLVLNAVATYENMSDKQEAIDTSWGAQPAAHFLNSTTINTVVFGSNCTNILIHNYEWISFGSVSTFIDYDLPLSTIRFGYNTKTIFLTGKYPCIQTVSIPTTVTELTAPWSISCMQMSDSVQKVYLTGNAPDTASTITIPSSAQTFSVSLHEGSTIYIPRRSANTAPVLFLNITNETGSVPSNYSIVYHGTFDEFCTTVQLQCYIHASSQFQQTTIQCTDGIAVWDRCDKVPEYNTSGEPTGQYTYRTVFKLQEPTL